MQPPFPRPRERTGPLPDPPLATCFAAAADMRASLHTIHEREYARQPNRYACAHRPTRARTGVPSESDVFAFAKHVAGHVSESGVVTDSHADLSGDDSSVGGNSLLRFARNVAAADSDAGATCGGGGGQI